MLFFKKKKAFTLSELLVVVIVLGILAAVSVPKFTRVLETRKTTEAEGMLSAVRTEQEKRCTLGDEYSVKFASLPVAASLQRSTEREAKSANYTYTLNGSGMQAQSSGKDYTIKMLSYKDGGLCCEGSYCSQLNKSYPSCGGVPADECAVRIPCSGSSSRSCGCQNTGTQYRSCDENTGSWGAWGSCSVGACKSCSGAATRSCGCNNSGTQRRTCNVFTGTWSGWSACSASDCQDCIGPATQSCGCNGAGTQYRTCNEMTGTWSSWSACSASDCQQCSGPATQSCGCNGEGTQSRTCDETTGTWGSWGACSIGECQGCSESSKPATSESCGCNNGGTRTRSVTCDQRTGSWSVGSWSECSKPDCQQCSQSSKPIDTQTCGNCGTQSRSVTCDQTTGTWKTGNWSTCTGQGECQADTLESAPCGEGYTGNKVRECDRNCQWRPWRTTSCKELGPCDTDPDGEACCRSKPECHWSYSKGYCDCSGGSSSSCTWTTVATYSCSANVPSSVCNSYPAGKCSVNNYCPGGGIKVEACI